MAPVKKVRHVKRTEKPLVELPDEHYLYDQSWRQLARMAVGPVVLAIVVFVVVVLALS